MKKLLGVLKKNGQVAEYTVEHAKWKKSRGRNPSQSYRGEKNPRKALAIACVAMEFVALRRSIPSIYVFDKKARVLTQRPWDEEYEFPYGNNYIEGDGSYENPYCYGVAAPVSPHYGLVHLWYRFHKKGTFIKANDWTLEASPEGVTASDGTFTKFTDKS